MLFDELFSSDMPQACTHTHTHTKSNNNEEMGENRRTMIEKWRWEKVFNCLIDIAVEDDIEEDATLGADLFMPRIVPSIEPLVFFLASNSSSSRSRAVCPSVDSIALLQASKAAAAVVAAAAAVEWMCSKWEDSSKELWEHDERNKRKMPWLPTFCLATGALIYERFSK